MANEYNDKAFEQEQERLQKTREYIYEVLESSVENQSAYQQNIKEALVELDHLDSSLSYVNTLANAQLLEMSNKEYRGLVRVKDEPYFSRIDFKRDATGQTEQLYIGKTSLTKNETQEPVIVDWRSPIANLYYEGSLGPASYEAEGEKHDGELSLKRQFEVEKGELQHMQDIDITARDQMLQDALSTNAEKRLKDIVTTIQAEQNRIIRADMDKPLIVQGVAGSGKTTIAMHRISYFIYTYADTFDPEDMMILAPNQLFLHYISGVLPELGVEEVRQTTFQDFFMAAMGKKYTIQPLDHHLLHFLEEGGTEAYDSSWIPAFKGSMACKTMLDGYGEYITSDLIQAEDLTVDRFTLVEASHVKQLYHDQYAYMPAFQRIDKIKKVVSAAAKKEIKRVIAEVKEVYEDRMEKVRSNVRDPEKRREMVVQLMDEQEAYAKKLEQEASEAIKAYGKRFAKPDIHTVYKNLMQDAGQLEAFGHFSKDEADQLAVYQQQVLKGKKIEAEDAAPLLYLQHMLAGVKTQHQAKNVVIDEAQDYSLLELYTLRAVTKTKLFTILGDLSQGIHSYRSIHHWEDVQAHVFPEATYTTLHQSYRTTQEIMEKANLVLEQSTNQDLPKARPVVRHGEPPEVASFQHNKDAAARIEARVNGLRTEGAPSIAVIGKTMNECRQLQLALEKQTALDSYVLGEKEDFQEEHVAIVPSYLAKGLEFDAVFVYMEQEMYHPGRELDVKLLYVVMTRALHYLEFVVHQRHLGSLETFTQLAPS